MIAKIKNNKALRVTMLYMVCGFLWILLSDELLFSFTKDPETLIKIENYKGWFFVASSGLLIFVLINKQLSKLSMANESLELAKTKYQTIFTQAADAIFEGNIKGDFIGANQAACNLSGYTGKELLEMNMVDLFSMQQLSTKPLLYDELNQGKSIISERDLRTKSGENIPVEMHSKKTYDNKYIAVVRNISSQREQQLKLKELVRERTSDLEHKNKQLERMNEVFVGREFRIKELREKIRELKKSEE